MIDVNPLGYKLVFQVPARTVVVFMLYIHVFAYHLPRLRAQVRPISVGMGIVPEIATGIQAASEAAQPPKG